MDHGDIKKSTDRKEIRSDLEAFTMIIHKKVNKWQCTLFLESSIVNVAAFSRR